MAKILFQKGHIPTKEIKRKISKALKGKKFSEEHKRKMRGRKFSKETKKKMREARLGREPWNKGKKLSDETRHKMSLSLIGNKRCNGRWLKEKNPNWKSGITPINNKIRGSLEYKLWQDSVFARDGYRCQKSGEIMKPYLLVAHHIQNFAQYLEIRFAIDNGITFCKDCHKLFHKKYGRKNNTKEQLEEFLKI